MTSIISSFSPFFLQFLIIIIIQQHSSILRTSSTTTFAFTPCWSPNLLPSPAKNNINNNIKPLQSSKTLTSHHDTTKTFTNNEKNEESLPNFVQVSFSHVHLYTDYIESIHVYKELENQINTLVQEMKVKEEEKDVKDVKDVQQVQQQKEQLDVKISRQLWKHINNIQNEQEEEEEIFIPQGRDIIKQLISGLGFRITGQKYIPNQSKNVVLTTKDLSGVQFIISSLYDEQHDDDCDNDDREVDNQYIHFDASK